MRQNTLYYIILLAIISVVSILLVQFVFIKYSYDLARQQFHDSTEEALKEVAEQVIEYNIDSLGISGSLNPDPVDKVSDNYYIVNVNEHIDKDYLKIYLSYELKKRGINTDYEFGIYDCESDKMVYGAYVCAENDSCDHVKTYDLPKTKKYTYYFGVNFPDRSPYFNARLNIWYFFTVLTLVVIVFFGYALSAIIRQRQLSNIQKDFINNLTHELKTPISSIAISAKVINDKNIINSPDRLSNYARIILEQNERLSKNVEKVLHLASIEKNKVNLKLENFDAVQFLGKIISQFKENDLPNTPNIKLVSHSSKTIIKADKFHFSQIISNIFENAVKYCKSSPEITVELLSETENLTINILDNGIGIPREYRRKIFQKFYRVPTGNVHDVKGFGLGLNYVKTIVKAHKWKISVSENQPEGSIFTLSIPVYE